MDRWGATSMVGNVGKVDDCVVGVHLGYGLGDFQRLLDSD
jgi:hypothetical protein